MLDWDFWKDVNDTIPKDSKKKRLGERWHLYQLHNKSNFEKLMKHVASQCAIRKNRTVAIDASSVWIDAKPQAHWFDAVAEWRNVELSDLLVVVNQVGTLGTNRKAMLIQAKWTDQVDELDKHSLNIGADDSSNKERDLLELCESSFFLYRSSKRDPQSAVMVGANNFSLFKETEKKIGHMDFSRYLLFSKEKSPKMAPYQTLLPSSRASSEGFLEHYPELLLNLADPDSSIPHADKNYPTWSHLIDTIIVWGRGKELNRFNKSCDVVHDISINEAVSKFTFRASLMAKLSHDGDTSICAFQNLASGMTPPSTLSLDEEVYPPTGMLLVTINVQYGEKLIRD